MTQSLTLCKDHNLQYFGWENQKNESNKNAIIISVPAKSHQPVFVCVRQVKKLRKRNFIFVELPHPGVLAQVLLQLN